MGRLFEQMRKLGLYDEATIVVHGDHGSRISLHSPSYLNRDNLTPEDYRDIYSVLFAIKQPGGVYREHPETVPLNVLMQRTAKIISRYEKSEEESRNVPEDFPFIYLTDTFPLLRHEVNIFEQQ